MEKNLNMFSFADCGGGTNVFIKPGFKKLNKSFQTWVIHRKLFDRQRLLLTWLQEVKETPGTQKDITLCMWNDTDFTISIFVQHHSISATGKNCSSVMFTPPFILTTINNSSLQGPHNSNVTPCQSVIELILWTEQVSRIWWRGQYKLAVTQVTVILICFGVLCVCVCAGGG